MATSPLITVRQTSGDYPVFVGRGLADETGQLVAPRGRVFVLTSPRLRPLVADRVAESFSPRAEVITVEEGESRKTLDTVNEIVTRLLERGARRDSLLVVVGGGMLGDTGAFAASVFLRGIDVVHVPTTLLAQVDSSIGGKTGVNHPLGKNLIGTFHVPRAVVSDPQCLDTLPQRDLAGGLFEALKAGVIRDPALFSIFEAQRARLLARDGPVLEEVVSRAIHVKASIVSEDEREGGLRRLLNYGHTIGHAIEAVLRYGHLSHGEAVAWGMIGANAIAVRRGLLAAADAARVGEAIAALAPTPVPPVDAGAIVEATAVDKKNTATKRVMALPRGIGEAVIVEDVTVDELAHGVSAIVLR